MSSIHKSHTIKENLFFVGKPFHRSPLLGILIISTFMISACDFGSRGHQPLKKEDSRGGGDFNTSSGSASISSLPKMTYEDIQPTLKQRCTGCHHKFDVDKESFLKLASGGKNSKVYKYVYLKSPKEMPYPGSAQSASMTQADRERIATFVLSYEAQQHPSSQSANTNSPTQEGSHKSNKNAKDQPGSSASASTNMPPSNSASEGQSGGGGATSDSSNSTGDASAGTPSQAGTGEPGVKPPEASSPPEEIKSAQMSFEELNQKTDGRTQTCVACHGQNGMALAPDAPHLAGLSATYIAKQLIDFRKSSKEDEYRWSETMNSAAGLLNESDIPLVAEYFSQFVRQDDMAMPENTTITSLKTKTEGTWSSCLGCHSGTPDAMGPNLKLQKATYLRKQIMAFKSGERTNSSIMPGMASTIDDKIVDDLVQYIELSGE